MSFYEDYKPIRNKIRNYNSKELINASILLLHDLSKKPVTDWKYLYAMPIFFKSKEYQNWHYAQKAKRQSYE